MVHVLSSFIGAAAILSSISNAAPAARPDSAIGDEVAVSAPNGVIESDTAALASATASADNSYGGMYGSSSADSSYSYTSAGSYDSSSAYGGSYTTSADYSMMTDSSSMMYDSSSVMYDSSSVMYDSSSVMYDSSSSMMYESSSSYVAYTSTYAAPPPMATYGSGSNSYGGSGYDSCVQQCMASYAPPMGSYSMPTATVADAGDTGTNGVTHTVIVAPTQGVLRYVPFATNASVGDTVRFVWGAGPHTVTKSSEFSVCNKTSDAPFASGQQNKSFIFDQVVNDTNPIFYYCGVPTHCEKGMFGIINPPSAAGSETCIGSMMQTWAQSNPDVQAMMSYSNSSINGTAATWGNSIDVASMMNSSSDPSLPMLIASNVLYSRMAFSANPGSLAEGGKFSPPDNMNTPGDFPAALLAAAPANSTSSSAASSSTSGSTSSSSTAAPASSTTAKKSGAVSVSSSRVLVGAAVLAATFFAL